MNISDTQLLREKLQTIYQIQARETVLLGQLDEIMNGLDQCFEERVFLVEEFGPEIGTRDLDPRGEERTDRRVTLSPTPGTKPG